MGNIRFFNQTSVKQISEEIRQSLAEIADRHGIRIEMSLIKFNGNHFTNNLSGSIIDNESATMTKQDEWNQNCVKFGLKPEMFGQKFMIKGREFQICGIRAEAVKYPVIAFEVAVGEAKQYKFDTLIIQAALNGSKILEES